MLAARLLWLATGCVWAARSLLGFAGPDYWEPVTALDWTAVWAFSAALILLAPSVILVGRLAPSSKVTTAAVVVAAGALAAGLANGIEDGFGVEVGGIAYVVGFVLAWLGLAVLAVMFGIDGRARLAALAGALVVGVALFTVGGGFIVLAALSSLAVAPGWFRAVAAVAESTRGDRAVGS